MILWRDADVYAGKLTPLVPRVIGSISALPVLAAACCTQAGELRHVACIFLVDFSPAGPGVAGLWFRGAMYLRGRSVVVEGGLAARNLGFRSRTAEECWGAL